jgi:hypothetical protein
VPNGNIQSVGGIGCSVTVRNPPPVVSPLEGDRRSSAIGKLRRASFGPAFFWARFFWARHFSGPAFLAPIAPSCVRHAL